MNLQESTKLPIISTWPGWFSIKRWQGMGPKVQWALLLHPLSNLNRHEYKNSVGLFLSREVFWCENFFKGSTKKGWSGSINTEGRVTCTSKMKANFMSLPLRWLTMRQLRPTYLSGHSKPHADRRQGKSAVCSFTRTSLLSWLTLWKALSGPYLVLRGEGMGPWRSKALSIQV